MATHKQGNKQGGSQNRTQEQHKSSQEQHKSSASSKSSSKEDKQHMSKGGSGQHSQTGMQDREQSSDKEK